MLSHLLLMRHAEPSWDNEDIADHDRPLASLGHLQADAVARALIARGVAPDIIWASDARRTVETAERLIRIIPGPQTIIRTPNFFHATARKVLTECTDAIEPSGNLMLLGHNPGWSDILMQLGGKRMQMSPACCAIFTRQNSDKRNWISPQNWQLDEVLHPNALLAAEEAGNK